MMLTPKSLYLTQSGSSMEHTIIHTPDSLYLTQSGSILEHSMIHTPDSLYLTQSGSSIEHTIIHTPGSIYLPQSNSHVIDILIDVISDDTNSNCPEEYYHNDTFSLCFKFFRDSVSHLEAEQLCQEQSASLTKIDSEEKQQHIMQYFGMLT